MGGQGVRGEGKEEGDDDGEGGSEEKQGGGSAELMTDTAQVDVT